MWPPRWSAVRSYRFLEMIPGLLVWSTLLLAILASFVWPTFVIGFALLLDVYWLVRIIYIMVFVMAAYRRYKRTIATDWRTVLKSVPTTDRLWHLIFVPTANEPDQVLRQTFTSLATAAYAPSRTIVVLAVEESSPHRQLGLYEKLIAEFGQKFARLALVYHPSGQPGEVAGKGSNMAWAGRQIKTWIDQRRIPYDDIIVTTLDSDSNIHPEYLAHLAVVYHRHPTPTRTSYQPIPLFHNNIWEALPWMRVVSYSTTFWLMSDTQRPDRLFTFSSHSMPFRALVDVDFWQTDVVSEDSRIFLQCLIRYDGDYQVTPMYVPISMDAIQAPGWWLSMKHQYKQIRRWAYGAENFPFMAWNFIANQAMPWRTKIRYLYYQIEGMYSWAVAPVLIMLLGWLPFYASSEILEQSVLAQNAPTALRWLMMSAMVGAVLSAILSVLMLPRQKKYPARQWLAMCAQWLLLPVTMIVFGSIPAIEAQSRLLLGKYLGFWVTEKHRQVPSTLPIKSGSD